MKTLLKNKIIWTAALGYFIDLFDLVLLGSVRVESLKSMGYDGPDLVSKGTTLLDLQMCGMISGGILWGLIGDTRGRRTALFSSILIYSLAVFFSGSATDFYTYAVLRFIAGVGLSGEFGTAVTLVSESTPSEKRGIATAIVTSIGFSGAIFAGWLSQSLSWQHAYQLGGLLGLILMLSRLRFNESELFVVMKAREKKNYLGSLKTLFRSATKFKTMIFIFMAGVPVWYIAAIWCYFAPEISKELDIRGTVTSGTTIAVVYFGAFVGNAACGVVSQKLKSRKLATVAFLSVCCLLALFGPLFLKQQSSQFFYGLILLIGIFVGYSSVWITWIVELFGTNVRATVGSVIPNLTRAAIIPILFLFERMSPDQGLVSSGIRIGMVCFALAIGSCFLIPETFNRTLDFVEE